MKGRGFGSFEKGGGGGKGGVQISALSGLVPLEEKAVRGACGLSSARLRKLTYCPCLSIASTPQSRVWGPGAVDPRGGSADSELKVQGWLAPLTDGMLKYMDQWQRRDLIQSGPL